MELELPFYGLHVFGTIGDTKVIHKQGLVNIIPYTSGDAVDIDNKRVTDKMPPWGTRISWS